MDTTCLPNLVHIIVQRSSCCNEVQGLVFAAYSWNCIKLKTTNFTFHDLRSELHRYAVTLRLF